MIMRRFLGYCSSAHPLRFSSLPNAHKVASLQILNSGYIANRTDLVARFADVGSKVAGDDDAGIFARAYEHWGNDLSRHVLGEYALAVHDLADRSLALFHDELGLVPLFYSATPGGITFSSRLDDLVLEVGTGELDEEFIADYFARGEHFGDRTPYRDIQRLLPGESIRYRTGMVQKHNAWTLAEIARLRYSNPQDYAEHLRQLVGEAVTAALPSIGQKTWCELSGGLDSSNVLCVANQRRAGIEAVSFIYPQSYSMDEQEWIKVVLREVPVAWHSVDVDSARPFTLLPDDFQAQPNDWIVRAAKKQAYLKLLTDNGVKIVLSGEGGDSVFLGDLQEPFFLADLLLRGQWGQLWKEIPPWANAVRGERSWTFGFLTYALRPAIRHLRSQTLEYRRIPIPWAAESFRRRKKLDQRGFKWWLPAASFVGDAYMQQRIMRSASIINTLYYDLHGDVEFRHPLMYRPLVEFMTAIPWSAKVTPDLDRALQRQAFRGVVPLKTLQRPDKGGGDQATIDGLENSRKWHAALTEQPRIVSRGYADLGKWRAALQQARFGKSIGLKYFQASADLEIWLQRLEGEASEGKHALEQRPDHITPSAERQEVT